jgi:hypothetical protein
MTEQKNFLRNVFDAVVESRTRQVEREMAHYRQIFDVKKNSSEL